MNRITFRLRSLMTATRQGLNWIFAGTTRCAGFVTHIGSRLKGRASDNVTHRTRREEKQRRKMLRREAERSRRSLRHIRKAA